MMDIKLLVTDIITSEVLFGSKLFSKIHHPILVYICVCVYQGWGMFPQIIKQFWWPTIQLNSDTLYLETVPVQAATYLSD